MRAWVAPLLEALGRGEAAALVHVVALKGSGPRDAGAQMLVTETAVIGTIGGGELEHAATFSARAAMETGRAAVARFALGPELGQCCGGAVTLFLEPFAPADRAWVAKLARAAAEPEAVVRNVRFDAGGLRRDWVFADGFGDFEAVVDCEAATIRERMNPQPQALWLFGAGHVGRAVAGAVAPLGFALTWIDGRAGQFPDPSPPGARTLALAMPELIVDEAPAKTVFLVMTHSHPLDEAICEAVLRRGDFAYLGLIGSATKRERFSRRLAAGGIAAAGLQRLVCPIGLAGIASKAPAAIAASVAADLLMRRERGFVHAPEDVAHGG